jgi:glycosyltransferase involved in cell wall biosynthesis
MKSLGIVISTPGRRSLGRALDSILYQRSGVEDVLVVGDGFDGATKELVEFYATLGLPARYVATVKTRDWGHTQVNYGLDHVKGDYVTYQDDDDIYLPRAIEEMVHLASEQRDPQPIIGRVVTPRFGLLWQRPNVTSCLDGHCIVLPNIKRKLGWMASVHSGDQCFLHTSLRNYDNWQWCDRVWTLTRPAWPLHARAQVSHAGGWLWSLYRDNFPAPVAILSLDKDPDSDRCIAKLDHHDLSRDELVCALQFMVYACQGNDCWFRFHDADNMRLRGALVDANFKEHTTTEFTHDWPPDFWPPVPDFDHTVNPENGEKLTDYRDDVWGGRSVK